MRKKLRRRYVVNLRTCSCVALVSILVIAAAPATLRPPLGVGYTLHILDVLFQIAVLGALILKPPAALLDRLLVVVHGLWALLQPGALDALARNMLNPTGVNPNLTRNAF